MTLKKLNAPISREERLPSYASMAQCSSATGIPLSIIRHASASGCDAFDRGNRVKLEPLLRWIFAQDKDSKNVDWHAHGKKFSALLAEVDYNRAIKAVIDREVVDSWIQTRTAIFFGELERVFGGEFPASVKGLSEVEIKKRSDAAIASLKDGLQKKFA